MEYKISHAFQSEESIILICYVNLVKTIMGLVNKYPKSTIGLQLLIRSSIWFLNASAWIEL